MEAVRRCVRAAGELGVAYLTLYAFSSENWRRPPTEITVLMGLLKRYVRSDLDDLARPTSAFASSAPARGCLRTFSG